MGTKQDPGKFDCYKNAEPDEPMFILLARDPLAPILVEAWAKLSIARIDGVEKSNQALQVAREMREWLEASLKKKRAVALGLAMTPTSTEEKRPDGEAPRGRGIDVFQAQDIEDVRLVDGGLIHVDLNSWVLPRPVKAEVVLDVPHPNIRGRYKVEGVTPGGFVASRIRE